MSRVLWKINYFLATLPKAGKDVGNVYINETQYFANVPEVAWNFYIGGYKPAQKWLKDRKDRELSTEYIFHYQKIIVALSETDRIMASIDRIEIQNWCSLLLIIKSEKKVKTAAPDK